MSLMNWNIRPKPALDDEDYLDEDVPWNLKPIEEKWEEYDKVFPTQRSLMKKEIGCWFPVESHRLLLKAITLPHKTKGGVLLTSQSRDFNTVYDIGLVIGIGPESYRDPSRFPYGPRCKIGDWIDFAPMEKQKKPYNGYLCYVIHDDRVNYPVPDVTKVVTEYRGYSLEEVQQIMAEERSAEDIQKFMMGR